MIDGRVLRSSKAPFDEPRRDHGPPRGSAPATLLLAEGNLPTAIPLLLRLQDHGFRTLHAPNGGWTLKLARLAQPDLVLLATDLPDGDGFIICRTLRAESRVPILLLVAQGQDGVGAGATHLQVRGLEVGADACLVWPVPFRELLARVHALLRRRALNGGNGPAPADRIAVGDIVLDRVTPPAPRSGGLPP